MKKLIVIADWAQDPLACQEFRSAIEGFIRDPSEITEISFLPIEQNTLHAAFTAAQVVETEERYGSALETVVFVMSDNHLSQFTVEGGTTVTNEIPDGNPFFIARLLSGVYVCGPNAGNTFSLVKSKIERVFTYEFKGEAGDVITHRSRDEYPKLLAYFMDALEDELELDEVHTNLIPELTEPCVLHSDTFGNLTVMLTKESLKGHYLLYEDVEITIGGITKKAKYVDKLFGDKQYTLVIFPGTSGNPEAPYLELAIWNGSAAHEFGDPKVGTAVYIKNS